MDALELREIKSEESARNFYCQRLEISFPLSLIKRDFWKLNVVRRTKSCLVDFSHSSEESLNKQDM